MILPLKSIACALSLSFLCAFTTADTLRPFTSDGCSYFPDGTFEQGELWLSCCQQHDFLYWQGGTYQQRLAADQALQICVAETGESTIATLMLAGVRMGGVPWIPTSFRWGYGWPRMRSYAALSVSQQRQVEYLIEGLHQGDPHWLLFDPQQLQQKRDEQ